MADYDLNAVWMDGERLIVQDAHLETSQGLEASTWDLTIDGAHMLHHDVDERVALKLALADGREVEGEARVTDPGDRDRDREIYFGARFEGLSALHRVL